MFTLTAINSAQATMSDRLTTTELFLTRDTRSSPPSTIDRFPKLAVKCTGPLTDAKPPRRAPSLARIAEYEKLAND
jgi:hypothetical protein